MISKDALLGWMVAIGRFALEVMGTPRAAAYVFPVQSKNPKLLMS